MAPATSPVALNTSHMSHHEVMCTALPPTPSGVRVRGYSVSFSIVGRRLKANFICDLRRLDGWNAVNADIHNTHFELTAFEDSDAKRLVSEHHSCWDPCPPCLPLSSLVFPCLSLSSLVTRQGEHKWSPTACPTGCQECQDHDEAANSTVGCRFRAQR